MQRKIAVIGIVFAFSLAMQTASLAQSIRTDTLKVSDPRPLAAAADLLERRYAAAVDYEDPLYVFSGDLIDETNTNSAYHLAHPEVRAIIPRGGSVNWSVNVDSQTHSLSNPLTALQQLMTAHLASGSPGEFTVRQIGTAYAIVPLRAKDTNGSMVDRLSPLDSMISLPSQQVNGIEAVKLICQAVSQVSGLKVTVGVIPYSLLLQQNTTFSANYESARVVLARMLDGLTWKNPHIVAAAPKLTWRLFYGADIQAYALNLHAVYADVPSPAGGTVRRLVPR